MIEVALVRSSLSCKNITKFWNDFLKLDFYIFSKQNFNTNLIIQSNTIINLSICIYESRKLTQGASITVRISCITSTACTNSSMISSTAVRILGAITGIYAFFVAACKCGWTVRVLQTFVPSTLTIRIPGMLWRANTSSAMILCLTTCIDSTLLVSTWVLAFLWFSSKTSLGQWTFIVPFTSSQR